MTGCRTRVVPLVLTSIGNRMTSQKVLSAPDLSRVGGTSGSFKEGYYTKCKHVVDGPPGASERETADETEEGYRVGVTPLSGKGPFVPYRELAKTPRRLGEVRTLLTDLVPVSLTTHPRHGGP